jgi:hypothetical protein
MFAPPVCAQGDHGFHVQPEKYSKVYFGGFLYIFSLTLPHSISVNLTYPDKVLAQGEHYLISRLTSALDKLA